MTRLEIAAAAVEAAVAADRVAQIARQAKQAELDVTVQECVRAEDVYVAACRAYWAAYDAEPLVPGVNAAPFTHALDRDVLAAYDASDGFTRLPTAV